MGYQCETSAPANPTALRTPGPTDPRQGPLGSKSCSSFQGFSLSHIKYINLQHKVTACKVLGTLPGRTVLRNASSGH